ncbi:MAG: undecaprenyldiphospho-muramoylpentapeptide beta-N-acetylglucosaminyltransferase [Acidiferrobacterales bacterium]|nr:undecaprenyldiphospho-muramoylpentapeptide beta-N-acetylglucosaminyltransferase [Acidiferrobacterales bacterium]
MNTVIIMAGGTGGHIYPALAVGTALRDRGVKVFWMGVRDGLESRLARDQGFEFDSVRTQGVWGKGVTRWLTMPLWLSVAILQCVSIILRRRPDALLGMGGYVCGPGGLAGWLLRRPLVIHESNFIPGLTNRALAFLATRILTGFEDTAIAGRPIWVGVPVRGSIIATGVSRDLSDLEAHRPLNLLVVGGSQGAQSLNEGLPQAVAELPADLMPKIRHQSGAGRGDDTVRRYRIHAVDAEVTEYIDDMSEAYRWADVIVARAGAMSLAEISVVGLAAVLVPFPYAAKDHQRINAEIFKDRDCALVCMEGDQFIPCLVGHLRTILGDRVLIRKMSQRIRQMARTDSTELVATNCIDVMQS